MHYLRIWADAAGESHFEEVTRTVTVQAAEPGVAALHLAEPVAVDRAQFLSASLAHSSPVIKCEGLSSTASTGLLFLGTGSS